MNAFQKLSPGYTPASASNRGDLFILRERILQAMLLFFALLGIPVAIFGSLNGIRHHEFYLPVIYASVYGLLLVILVLRALPYKIRAALLTGLVFFLALSELVESGQTGDMRMFLIAFTSLVAILFGYRAVIGVNLLSLLTIAGTGIYAAATPAPVIPVLAGLRNGTDWVTSATTFFMISTILCGAITVIISGLSSNLARQAELRQSLEYERDALEDRIQERTRNMTRRITQLRAAAELAQAISGLSDPDTLVQQVVNLMKERFDLYYAGVFLLDSSHQYAVLRAGTGEPGKRMLAQSHQLAVSGSSMIGWAITNRKARIALDVGSEAVRFNNPFLPATRSEVALPIIVRETVLGAMSIQSDKPNAFDENDIAILKSVVDGMAIALENDRLYHETRKSLEEVRMLNRGYLQQAWSETIETYGELAYDYENPNIVDEATSKVGAPVDIPLIFRNEVIGTITLEMDHPELTEEEKTFIENVTTQTAIALENARLLHETERRAVQEQKLNELASRFARALSVDEILRAAVQELGRLPSVADVSVQLSPAGNSSRKPSRAPGNGNSNGKVHSK